MTFDTISRLVGLTLCEIFLVSIAILYPFWQSIVSTIGFSIFLWLEIMVFGNPNSKFYWRI